MSFLASIPTNTIKLMGVPVPAKFVSERIAVSEEYVWSSTSIKTSDTAPPPSDYVYLVSAAIVRADTTGALEESIYPPKAPPQRAPEECLPENFEKLLREGRLEEYQKLVEKCYVRVEHINYLVDWYKYTSERVKQVVFRS